MNEFTPNKITESANSWVNDVQICISRLKFSNATIGIVPVE